MTFKVSPIQPKHKKQKHDQSVKKGMAAMPEHKLNMIQMQYSEYTFVE